VRSLRRALLSAAVLVVLSVALVVRSGSGGYLVDALHRVT